MKSLPARATLAGIAVYVWSVVSWMVLPWHNSVIHSFPDEDIVGVTVQSQAPRSGIYVIPGPGGDAELAMKKMARGPIVFLSVRREGVDSMASMMVFHLLSSVGVAFLLALLVKKSGVSSYWHKVGLTVLMVGIGGFLSHAAYWNWWYFSLSYSLITFIDLLIAWTLAALILSRE